MLSWAQGPGRGYEKHYKLRRKLPLNSPWVSVLEVVHFSTDFAVLFVNPDEMRSFDHLKPVYSAMEDLVAR